MYITVRFVCFVIFLLLHGNNFFASCRNLIGCFPLPTEEEMGKNDRALFILKSPTFHAVFVFGDPLPLLAPLGSFIC